MIYNQAHENVTQTNSSISNIYVEFKGKAEEDSFMTNIPDKQPSVSRPFMSQTTKGVSTAGQNTTYVTLQLDSQYCTHVFSVLIVGNYVWLIQWDQSGTIVTAPIYYQQDPVLLDFFTHFDQAERPV